MNNQEIHYRPMNRSDIPAGLRLCRLADWNQTAKDWELFHTVDPGGCHVATDQDEKVVGTVATIRYQDHFSWIGMVLVDPMFQGRGIGLQLVREALGILPQAAAVRLDATPAGRAVYLKLGFENELPLLRLVSDLTPLDKLCASTAIPMSSKDFSDLLTVDRRVFGADREPILQQLYRGASQLSFVVKDGNKIIGYCLGRYGYRFVHVGPIVANDQEGAANLISAVLQTQFDRPVILDVPEDAADWISWLLSIGFSKQRQLIRMIRGSNAYPGVPENQFAILGPEFG